MRGLDDLVEFSDAFVGMMSLLEGIVLVGFSLRADAFTRSWMLSVDFRFDT